ncbi:thioesterase [Roseivirga spongicola]|jgi:1,4-dihydroxy-2-naphthoyl-CoA hydrolase|uniref:Thioesterase n=1 Tax=Roseivirga spongicola TaxID=333140 RepID=A0A150X6C7_9BACT|nr:MULTISPECIES: hotdog fold thioesterase [Roseivirga]KYG74244.1 thioesterase [Roseivirga spongicola]MBO6660583.1 hotdog fold thioesterase [Roseivirga sp.]MBO6761445.1 hotdog fold thioesterase [Roseivirga sp.]MBO6906680.1 hotdog fold thioesterase [Roseivirga sp.]
MFNPQATLDIINQMGRNTLVEHLGIEMIELGKDYLVAKMPVDHRTHQPLGMLHGGASVVLAETLGSVAATLTVDPEKQYCVGLDINANHIKSAREGYVFGKTTPIHVGKKTQVWEIKITNDEDQLICISRITMAVLDRK